MNGPAPIGFWKSVPGGTITVSTPTGDSRIGSLAVPGVLSALSGTPGSIRWLDPELGVHTEEVLCDVLGRSEVDIDDLRAEGAI